LSSIAPNKFESGGTRPTRSVWNFFFVPSTFLVQQVVLVSAFVMVSTVWPVQFGHCLVCCSSIHGAHVSSHLLKWEARAPVPYGVGATVFVNGTCVFHSRSRMQR